MCLSLTFVIERVVGEVKGREASPWVVLKCYRQSHYIVTVGREAGEGGSGDEEGERGLRFEAAVTKNKSFECSRSIQNITNLIQ